MHPALHKHEIDNNVGRAERTAVAQMTHLREKVHRLRDRVEGEGKE